ncbi:MAG: hypothetical protein AAF191_15275 [Verrucomicrobiota bacterium]
MMHARRQPASAFSVLEVLVAISLSTVFFTAATMVYQNVTYHSNPLGTIETVDLGKTTLENLYGISEASIRVYSAPSYGRATFAAHLADTFQDDVASASAVFVLGRNNRSGYRPTTIPYPSGSRRLDAPWQFRAHIVSVAPSETGSFVSYSAVNKQPNLSIFLLQPHDKNTELNVLAIYELDVIPVTGKGNYVTVRRYIGNSLSAYYDVLYPTGTGSAFSPNAVHFFRKGLAPIKSGTDLKFSLAEEMPFYFVWWPDPAARTLESPTDPPTPAVPTGSALLDYYKMGGRTQFFFTVPAFPSFQ